MLTVQHLIINLQGTLPRIIVACVFACVFPFVCARQRRDCVLHNASLLYSAQLVFSIRIWKHVSLHKYNMADAHVDNNVSVLFSGEFASNAGCLFASFHDYLIGPREIWMKLRNLKAFFLDWWFRYLLRITLRFMSFDLTDKSTLVQVMAWCRQQQAITWTSVDQVHFTDAYDFISAWWVTITCSCVIYWWSMKDVFCRFELSTFATRSRPG